MIKKVIIEKAERLQKIPPGPSVQTGRIKLSLVRRGVDIIDLGELNPDPSLRDFFILPVDKGDIFAPCDSSAWRELKRESGKWLQQKYDLRVRAEAEVLPFFGQRKMLHQLLLSLINPGDLAALPDPCAPIYRTASILAGAELEVFPLLERNDYLPNLSALSSSGRAARLPKILFLNYPHDPTSAVTDSGFYRDLVEWAGKKNVLVISDVSGNEICYDDHTPVSLLQTKGARKLALEEFSFFALTGVHFGFLVGDRGIIAQTESLQQALGDRPSKALVLQALELLRRYPEISHRNNLEFTLRRATLLKELFKLSWKARKPKAGPFVWVKVPARYSSVGFCRMLFRKTGVILSPGFEFGEHGEGYVRIALNPPAEQLRQATDRLLLHSHIWQRRYRPKS
jgi:LL-diaminopimelate aminotransferase